MRRVLAGVLAELPNAWRRAVLLSQAEGLSCSAVARQLGVTEHDIVRWLEYADAFLKAKLEEVGIKPGESEQPADYIVPGSLSPALQLAREFDDVVSSLQRGVAAKAQGGPAT
jgi:hypothetical protein